MALAAAVAVGDGAAAVAAAARDGCAVVNVKCIASGASRCMKQCLCRSCSRRSGPFLEKQKKQQTT